MSGSVYGLHRYLDQYAQLVTDPALVANLVPEILRWQTPLSYMRRTATCDTELGGKQIRKDDQLLMWYLSANRDEQQFGDDADAIDLHRPNADRHLSFAYGVHFCMGSRLAELQLRILWEEILRRFDRVEVVGEPGRTLLRSSARAAWPRSKTVNRIKHLSTPRRPDRRPGSECPTTHHWLTAIDG